jgi:hypothetical protein
MHRNPAVSAFVALALVVASFVAAAKTSATAPPAKSGEGPPVLWRDPGDLRSRDLYYGSGGLQHQPAGPFVFGKEENTGTQPKFQLVDANGVRWTAKVGIEARPETAASRFLWAVGYFANDDYFLPAMPVQNLPHLRGVSSSASTGGVVHDVRLKRHSPDEVKLGIWEWGNCPFVNTREWNGLRVLMALINNWDVKDINNSIYQLNGANPEQRYMVTDLGSSFGPTTLSRSLKGNLRAYRESKWIHAVSHDYVDFNVPGAPSGAYFIAFPIWMGRLSLDWVGRHIPRADARWIGDLLGRLSPSQIRDAFRAAGYSAQEVEGFSQIVERRVHELQQM